jgi:hypothetical protein
MHSYPPLFEVVTPFAQSLMGRILNKSLKNNQADILGAVEELLD